MSKFVIAPHMRLHEWVAVEKGYFDEVELDFDETQPGRFTARYIGPNDENRLIHQGRGSFEYIENHVVTTFAIPNSMSHR